jgi:hypothetical protein
MPYHPDAEREALRTILPQLLLTAAAIEALPAIASVAGGRHMSGTA